MSYIHCHCTTLRTSTSSSIVFCSSFLHFSLCFLNVLSSSFFTIVFSIFFCKHFLHHFCFVVALFPLWFATHHNLLFTRLLVVQMFWCSLCSIVIVVHQVQLFTTTCGSIVCHYLSLKYGFMAHHFDCCSLLEWLLTSKMCSLLLLFGLVACYWSTLVFVHRSSALVATCHASSKKFNTKICLLSPILEKMEPEVIFKS